jgi:hypothetical protein
MDLKSLSLVSTANSKKPAAAKSVKEEFAIHRTTTVKGIVNFTVTKKFFDDHGLASNSLSQFNSPDGVVIAVTPGNSGVFFRNTKKGAKGRTFKNDELNKALNDKAFDGKYFALDLLGEDNGIKYFQVRPVRTSEKPTVEAEGTEGGEQAAEVSEAAPAVTA